MPHVFGLPRSAAPRAVRATRDRPSLRAPSARSARSFPGTSGALRRGSRHRARRRLERPGALPGRVDAEGGDRRRGAAQPRRASRRPARTSTRSSRRMLVDSDNDAANAVESTFGGGSAVDELLRGLGIGDTWMGGGYLHGTPVLPPIPRPGREPAVVPLLQVHDRVRPRAPVHRRAPRRRRARAADRPLRQRIHALRRALPALPARPRAATGASSAASSAAARTRSCTRRAGSRTPATTPGSSTGRAASSSPP